VEFVLHSVNVDFIFNLAQPWCGIVSERAMRSDAERGQWIGTGAFYITDFAANDFVSFARNEDYWGEPAPTGTISMRFIREASARTAMMLSGAAQLTFGVGADDMRIFEDNPDFDLFPFTLSVCNTIAFNMDDPIAGDLNFRMAVASAIRRDEIAAAAAGNYAAPAADGVVWGLESEFRAEIPLIPYNQEAARRFLEASPYNGEEIEIATAMIMNVRASEVIQAQLAEIGVYTRIHVLDVPGFVHYTAWGKNQTQMAVFMSAMTPVASSYRYLVGTGQASNRTQYSNPVIEELLDRAAAATDLSARRALYQEMQRIVSADPPFFNLFWRTNAAVMARGVGGVRMPYAGLYDLRYVYWNLDA
jgi:peptide/nickel transport system substrate-binding protein